MVRVLAQLLLTVLLLSQPICLRADSPDNILIIHSYSQEYPWTKSQHQGFISTYMSAYTEHTIISTEYLDTKRRSLDKDYSQQFFQYLQFKYQNFKPSLLYVSDDNALKFAMHYLLAAYPRTPIIFSGVNDYTALKSLDSSRVTGVFEKKDIAKNLEFLIEIEPQIKEITIVGDGSNTYQAIEYEIKQQLKLYPTIKAQFIASQDIKMLTTDLARQSSRYVFLTTLGGMLDEQGHTLTLSQAISKIAETGDFAIMSMEDAYLVKGVLGGFVTNGRLQGVSAAELAIAYRQGKGISQLPAKLDSPNSYIFNFNELDRLQLKLSDSILKQSELLNPPVSFFQQHRDLIVSLVIVFAMLLMISLLVFSLVLTRKNRLIQQSANQQNKLIQLFNEQAQKLSQAQEIAHIGSYVWDVVEDLTTWSDELYRIAGYHFSEFSPTYENYVSCIHSDDVEKFKALTRHVLENKNAYEGGYRLVRPGGEVRYVYEQGDVRLDASGKVQRLVGVIRDITEQAEHEARLMAQLDFNDTVLEVAGNVIVVIDMQGCFYRFNRAAEELTGFRREDVLGKPVWDFVIPEDQREGVKHVFENLSKGNVETAGHYENDWLTADGGRRALDWRNSVLKNAAGEITHVVALGYDITERRQAEDQQQRLQRELNQARKNGSAGTVNRWYCT